ncbi:S-layer protein [uncultured archaeon]|nr:S-layer protein [uncultured archaeon]
MKIASFITIGSIMTLAICLVQGSIDQVELRSEVANLGMPEFTWTSSNFAGFYYDIDKNIGAEQLTFMLSDIKPNSATLSDQLDAYGFRGIVYTTQAQPKNFKFKPWGQYETIGLLSDENFAAYDSTVTSGMQVAGEGVAYLYDQSKSKNLLSNELISKVLTDDNTERTISSDHPLLLSEGYQLAIKSLDVTTNKAYLELSKNGQVVDNKVVQPSISNAKMVDKTYYYKANLGNNKDIIQIAVHLRNAFKSNLGDVTTVDGVFQISDQFEQINVGRLYGSMSIRMVNPANMTITMDNKDHQITLSKNKNMPLTSNFFIKTANKDKIDSSQPLRYYIYKKYTDPGSYQLRGSVANLGQNEFIWDKSTFPGFYYDIDNDLGAEQLTFRLSNSNPESATLSDQPDANGFRGILYTTHAQPKSFEFKPWGQYEVIGFLTKNYFAAYSNTITADMQTAGENSAYIFDQSRNRNLMANDQIGKVLIDSDTEKTITSAEPLKLKEGYEMAIKSIDTSDKKAYLELSKNGQVLDSKAIQPSIIDAKMSDKTYYYSADLGDTKRVVQIAVHFKNAFVGSDTNIATIDGIFQISDSITPIMIDQQYDKMSIRSIDSSSLSIIMDNKDNQITLSKDKDLLLMKDIHIKTADQDYISAENPLRYCVYEAVTIGNLPNQPPVITNFVSSRDSNILPGEPVIFNATVSDPDINDQILYKFFLNGEPVTDWSPLNQWTWAPTTSEVDNNTIEVTVVDQKHAGKDGFDDKKDLEIRIESGQPILNQPPIITNFIASKGNNNVISGDSVIFTATANDPDIGDQILYKFFLNGISVTDWGLNNNWTWTTKASNVGKNQVEVRVIDQKHAGIDSFDNKGTLEIYVNGLQDKRFNNYIIIFVIIICLWAILIGIYRKNITKGNVHILLKILMDLCIYYVLVILIKMVGLDSSENLIFIAIGFVIIAPLIHKLSELIIVYWANNFFGATAVSVVNLLNIVYVIDLPDGSSTPFGEITNKLRAIFIITGIIFSIVLGFLFHKLSISNFDITKDYWKLIPLLIVILLLVMLRPTEPEKHYIQELVPDASSPQVPGSTVKWIAVASGPDHALFKFFLNGKPTTEWAHKNYWIWNISEVNIGENKIEVRTKDDRITDRDEIDDSKIKTCMIGR